MNNSLAVREALLNSAGIARMPTFVVRPDIRKGRLRPILTNDETLQISIFVVFPQRQHLAPEVRAFVDFMAEGISEDPYWDRPAPVS